jgi:hypothetical protein
VKRLFSVPILLALTAGCAWAPPPELSAQPQEAPRPKAVRGDPPAPRGDHPPKLVIPAEVRPAGDYATVQPDTDAVSVTYVGLSGVDPFPSQFLADRRSFVLPTRGLPGNSSFRFAAVGSSKDGGQVRVDFAVVLGTPTPTPPGPTPPGPTPPGPTPPGPQPPGPTPPQPPAPIPGPGLKVAVVYESGENLTPEQNSILYGEKVSAYLNQVAAPGPGGRKFWRILEQNRVYPPELQVWNDVLKRPRTSLPWIVISNSATGYEGPLPPTEDQTIELVKKYVQP